MWIVFKEMHGLKKVESVELLIRTAVKEEGCSEFGGCSEGWGLQ